jgi:hypothetical protein
MPPDPGFAAEDGKAVSASSSDHPGARRSRTSGWRAALTWGLVWTTTAQAVLIAFLEWRHPEFLDPKYGCRMLALRALREEHKERQLMLVLGSSRAEQGFRPSLLTCHPAAPARVPLLALRDGNPGPLFYNMARGGSSPLLYLVTLRRLLADGIHPDVLLVEIFPPALCEEEDGPVIYKPTLRDLPLLRRYPTHGRTWAFWLQDRLLLWYKYRSGFLAWAAPQLLPPQARWGEHLWDYQGGEWRIIGRSLSPQQRRRLTDDAHHRYAHALSHFRIAADADRALRELLEICQRQRIAVVLFVMPEAHEFRSWYPPRARRQLSDYLTALREEYGTPVIDARCWIDDGEFSDGHHLLSRGAAAFTRHFAGEVLSSLDQGTPVRQRRAP